MLKHVPNILTIIRFLLVPFIVSFALQDNYIVAAIFLVISGITDVADGYIARKFNFVTDFGKLMDPLADKCTQVATLIVLVVQGIIPLWILIVVLIKEFLLVVGASFLYGKDLVVSSKWYGKISTVLFYVAIFMSMIFRQFNLPYTFDSYVYYLAVGFTLFSLIMYFKAFFVKDYLKKGTSPSKETD
ncbi:MAG: CDP-diacylglycerol--glycerol-3-phosphate 3-phosphatidyltransferase [Clostridia bacterium]|nr:CDP-diacylglycerol--glycerol-3-phosphate 3-phosphatidyltransferase [Clostridia bacterium]